MTNTSYLSISNLRLIKSTIFIVIAIIFSAIICSFRNENSNNYWLAPIKDVIIPFVCRYNHGSLLFLFAANNNSICRLHRTVDTINSRRWTPTTNAKSNAGDIVYFVEPFEQWDWSPIADDADDVDSKSMRVATMGIAMMQPSSAGEYDREALTSLHVAIEYRNKGNYQKAKVVLEHAIALAPSHPDILTEYGIFMEIVHDNVVDAQTMFTKALTANPGHSEALHHRQRTLPLVEAIDNKMLHDIDEKREWFLKIPRWNPSLRRAMRESYFQHIYHTVALEGNTMSLMQTRSILETRIAVGGKSIIEHNEILGMDSALRYLNRSLVHRIGDIDMDDILHIHRHVLGFVDPIQAGMFRRTQVYVGSFMPVPPEMVLHEMNDFLQWLNAEDALRIHPVELAALAHYKFVYIHPFIDGNGRTARLLMNLILMQAGFPPVIIPVENRLQYYETLRTANDGDLRPFIRFIASNTDRTLQMYINSVVIADVTPAGQRNAPEISSSFKL